MVKIIIILSLFAMAGTAQSQNGMFMPKTIDTLHDNMYPTDTCKCYVIILINIGFDNQNDWSESTPITWTQVIEWMTKEGSSKNYPESYRIINICDTQKKKWKINN